MDYKKLTIVISVVALVLGLAIGAVGYVNGESKVVASHIAKPWHDEAGELLRRQDSKLDDIADRTTRIEIQQQYQTERIEEGFEAILEKLSD